MTLLKTAARFLVEDDTHVVLAIRIEKRALQDSLPVIRAAEEIAISAGPSVRRASSASSVATILCAILHSTPLLLLNWALTIPALLT